MCCVCAGAVAFCLSLLPVLCNREPWVLMVGRFFSSFFCCLRVLMGKIGVKLNAVSSLSNRIINVMFPMSLLNVFLIVWLQVTDGHLASECFTVGNMLLLC